MKDRFEILRLGHARLQMGISNGTTRQGLWHDMQSNLQSQQHPREQILDGVIQASRWKCWLLRQRLYMHLPPRQPALCVPPVQTKEYPTVGLANKLVMTCGIGAANLAFAPRITTVCKVFMLSRGKTVHTERIPEESHDQE